MLACPPDVADAVYAGVEEFAVMGREYKIYGEPVPVPDSAPTLDRALALSGRDPGWSP